MNKNYSLNELTEVAKEIIRIAKHKVLLFYGPMGVGKTTLIKVLCQQLGVTEITHSPSFTLVNEYITTTEQTVYHFDCYRIKNEDEAYDIGIEEYFYSNAWVLVEWAEKINNLVPLAATKVHLSILENGQRNIQL